MAEEDPQLKSTKAMIRSVLISEKDGVAASRFMRDYREITGEQIPFRKFGHGSLEEFIRSIKDVVFVRTGITGELTYFAVADDATAHIQKLVSKQKSKKPRPVRKGPTRFPKAHSQFRKFGSKGGGFSGSYRLSAGFRTPMYNTPKRRSPSPLTAFSSANVSPLMVTVRQNNGHMDERLIERKSVSMNGGKKMATRALKAAFGEKPADRKLARQYELPPRFQRQAPSSSPSSNTVDKPVAVVCPQIGEGPALAEDKLPREIKSWVSTLLKAYPSGLWSTRFLVLYKETFEAEAPTNLIDIVSKWTDIALVEMNKVANRQVLYPSPDKSKESTPDKAPHPPVPHHPKQLTPPREMKPVWQEFNVPDAELLPVDLSKYVYLSYFVDLGHFYVQEEQSCIDDVTAKLGAACQDQAVPKLSDLHAGIYCAALYSEDDNWYRARICYTASEAEIEVFFIDYGNVEKVRLANIRCLTKETSEVPAQAINCTLFGLKPLAESGWSQKAVDYFTQFVSEKRIEAVTYSHSEGQCVVELFADEAGDESLNQRLFEAGLVGTSLKADEQTEVDMDGEPLDLELPDSEYIEVVLAYMDLSLCCIRLVGPNFSDKLEAFEDRLASLYKAAESSRKRKNLGTDSVCIASVDLLYHRVRILKLEQEEAQCFFLDHGYTERVPVDQLQPLDPEINKTIAYQAIPCLLAGLEPFMKLPTTTQELIQMSQSKICMAEMVCRDPLTIMLYDTSTDEDININKEIAKKLTAEGAKVDMDVFSTSTDSVASESSGTSSPRSQSSTSVIADVDRLQSVAQRLSLGNGASDSGYASQTSVVSVEGGGTQQRNLKQAQHVPQQQQSLPQQSVTQEQQRLYTWGSKNTSEPAASAPASTSKSPVKPITIPPTSPSSNPSASSSPGVLSPASPTASAVGAGAAATSNDSLSIAYHTWPLPGYVPLPRIGEFFDVHIQWISDPSNFVIIPHTMLPQLKKLMKSIKAKFQAAQTSESGDSASGLPTVVPDPKVDHLYLALVDGSFTRAIFKGGKEMGLHIYLPDYCMHHLVNSSDIFFLPKQYWSVPFAAFKASLYGVKPPSRQWLESSKYKFVQLALNKTLVALIKSIEGDSDFAENDDDVVSVAKQQLYLHLVDTSDNSRDVVIAEELVDLGLAESSLV